MLLARKFLLTYRECNTTENSIIWQMQHSFQINFKQKSDYLQSKAILGPGKVKLSRYSRLRAFE